MIYSDLTLTDYIDYGLLPITINLIIFWFVAIIFMALDDYCDTNNLLEKYKYQGRSLKKGINWEKYHKTLRLVICNQLFVNVPFSLLLTPFNKKLNDYALPYIYLPFQIIGILLVEDVIFYAVHYAIHTKFLYKHIHAIHHEWTAPVAVRALYSHPIEHICGNVLPVLITGYMFRLDWFCYNIWFNMATFNALIVHSDYNICGFGEGHDKHHKYRKYQYGALGVVDMLLGTYYC